MTENENIFNPNPLFDHEVNVSIDGKEITVERPQPKLYVLDKVRKELVTRVEDIGLLDDFAGDSSMDSAKDQGPTITCSHQG